MNLTENFLFGEVGIALYDKLLNFQAHNKCTLEVLRRHGYSSLSRKFLYSAESDVCAIPMQHWYSCSIWASLMLL